MHWGFPNIEGFQKNNAHFKFFACSATVMKLFSTLYCGF